MNNGAVLEQIKKQNKIIIAGHTNPDGDAIGACFAFAHALKNIGKKPKILLEAFSSTYDFLPTPVEVVHQLDPEEKIDLFIALDCGDEQRLNSYVPYLKNATSTINIDHHTSNTMYGDYNIVSEEVSSTCELLYDLFEEWQIPITSSIALCLYTGIVYDTGSFQHTSTTPKTHWIASHLLKHKIDSSFVSHQLFHRRSYEKTKLLGTTLARASLYYHDQVSLSFASWAETKSLGTGDTEGIVQFLAEIDDVSVAVFLYELYPNEVKVSLRSRDDVNVAAVASQFGGGGHTKAAGCTIFASVEEAKRLVLEALEDFF